MSKIAGRIKKLEKVLNVKEPSGPSAIFIVGVDPDGPEEIMVIKTQDSDQCWKRLEGETEEDLKDRAIREVKCSGVVPFFYCSTKEELALGGDAL